MSRKNKSEERKLFAISDLFVIFGVLALLIVLFVFLRRDSGGELCAEICVGGEEVDFIALSDVKEDYTLNIEGTEILVSSDGIRFVSSPCSDKICVDRGVISKAGDSAVCLPQRVSVRIVSTSRDPGNVDAVSG